jgi:hypothetical protein
MATGIGLDEGFDLVTDESGDVGTTSGAAEVEKDLSLVVASIISATTLGGVPTANEKARLESRLESRLDADSRVIRVQRARVVNVTRDGTPEVDIQVVTTAGTLEL